METLDVLLVALVLLIAWHLSNDSDGGRRSRVPNLG